MSDMRHTGPAGARSWLGTYLTRYWKSLALALALGVLAFVFAAALMTTSGWLVAGAASVEAILVLEIPLILVRVFGVGKPLIQYACRLTSHDWVLRMTSGLRRDLWNALARRGDAGEGGSRAGERADEQNGISATSRGGSERGSGEVLGLLADDVEHLQNLWLRVAFPVAVAWVVYAIVLAVCGMLSPVLAGMVGLIVGIELTVVPLVTVLVERARRERISQVRAGLYDTLADDVLGIADWGFSGRRREFLERHEQVQGELRRLRGKSRQFARLRDLAVQVLMGLVVVVLVCWAAGEYGAGGTSWVDSPNWVAALALGFFPLIECLAPVPQAAADSLDYRSSLENLGGVLGPAAGCGSPSSMGENRVLFVDGGSAPDGGSATSCGSPPPMGENRVSFIDGGSAPRGGSAPGGGSPPPMGENRVLFVDGGSDSGAVGAAGRESAAGEIRLEHVSYAYGSSARQVLDDVTLDIEAGSNIAVLGRSGAGKSTLLALICGELAPTAGSVRVDGAEASELRGEMHRHIGLIAQDSHLFNMSLYDNVRLARDGATREEVLDALAAVGLAGPGSLVERLPRGIDSIVAESAATFSGGEAQRVALARVLIADTPIVLLDEPFVSLDPACERDMLATLTDVLADRTVVMVTHHLAGVESADDVVFLADGKITLHGSPAELAETSPRYRELLEMDGVSR